MNVWDTPEGKAWLATRPPAVQELLREFPPSARFELDDGSIAYMIGCTEVKDGEPMLKLSLIDPRQDYATAIANTFHVCPDHFRRKP